MSKDSCAKYYKENKETLQNKAREDIETYLKKRKAG